MLRRGVRENLRRVVPRTENRDMQSPHECRVAVLQDIAETPQNEPRVSIGGSRAHGSGLIEHLRQSKCSIKRRKLSGPGLDLDRDETKSKHESAQIIIEGPEKQHNLYVTRCAELEAERNELKSKYESAQVIIELSKKLYELSDKRCELEAGRNEIQSKYDSAQATIEELKKRLEQSEKQRAEVEADRDLLDLRYGEMITAYEKLQASLDDW